ncbi:MAG: ATP-grasp domain-containing protein [Alphaproteobacteria bacterium]|nr:ATP-grasp domain-containing protein [Alphaproteobacteria bacterium]
MKLSERRFAGKPAAPPSTIVGIGLAPVDIDLIANDGHDGPLRAILVNGADVEHGDACEPRRAAAEIRARLAGKNIRVDGIVSCDDYPCCLVASHLAEALGLTSPSLLSLMLLQHKYWSRTIQARVVPAHTPGFDAVDLGTHKRLDGRALRFPCWVKPIKSSMSFLALRAANAGQLSRNLQTIAERMNGFQFAFNASLGILDTATPGLPAIGGEHAIIEEELKGRQVTLEGYVAGGRAVALGVVDSCRTANRRSFARFEYPSRLPRRLQDAMARIAAAVLREAGFDNGFFNVEFFVDARTRDINILEINPRFCSQFSPLYLLVDGRHSHRALVDLALGRPVAHPKGKGQHRVAACFVLRLPHDARVQRVPTAGEIAAAESLVPASRVELLCAPSRLLSDYVQDEFTYRYACVYVGADRRDELARRCARIVERLKFRFEPAEARDAAQSPTPVRASTRPRRTRTRSRSG